MWKEYDEYFKDIHSVCQIITGENNDIVENYLIPHLIEAYSKVINSQIIQGESHLIEGVYIIYAV